MLRNSIDKRCVRCGLYIARTFTSEEICECAQPSLSEPPKQGETPMADALAKQLDPHSGLWVEAEEYEALERELAQMAAQKVEAERRASELEAKLAEAGRDAERWKRMYECAQNANSFRQDAIDGL